MRKLYILLFFGLMAMLANVTDCLATHIKAADIKVIRNPADSKDYTFTLYVYFDKTRVDSINNNSYIATTYATLDFGDNTTATTTREKPLEDVSDGVVKGTYVFNHIYQQVGTFYVSYTENNRVSEILNMDNSVNTPLYIETLINIDPFSGINDSPILTIPPIDNANSGQLYTYNTGAYDPNGDSLSFSIIPTKQGKGKNVDAYTNPDDTKFNGKSLSGAASTFNINAKTGDITWDTPGQAGIYNIAIRVSEFRNGVRIGYIIRDMQIVVKDGRNKPPKLKLPNDTCLIATGNKILLNIITSDPDGNSISTDMYGSQVVNGKAVLKTNIIYFPPPSTTQLQWQPSCGDAQDQPYLFNFQAQDYPPIGAGEKLYDFKTLSIKLNAPEPTNFKVRAVGKSSKLTWDPYNKTCSAAKFQDTIKAVVEIYRQECDSIFTNNDCNAGRSSFLSGELIANVPITDTVFIDDNGGKGLKIGTYYFYTIKPRSNDKSLGGGAAIAPTPKGIMLSPNVPLIKQITVTATGTAGKIKVAWVKPFDTLGLVPPFEYQLFRSAGLSNNNYQLLTTISANTLLDTFYVDQANTKDSLYLYLLKFKANGIEVGQTEPASNVLLKSKANNGKISLEIRGIPHFIINHFNIYNANTKALIQKLVPQTDTLSKIEINNLKNCDTACFIVESVGRYCVNIGEDSIVNESQQLCDVPKFGSKPVVQIGIKESICGNYTCKESFPNPPYQNFIFWKMPISTVCDQPKGFAVYYAENDKATFNKIGFTSDSIFVHPNLQSFAGCYAIKTVNFNDEEGEASNIVCQDVCPCFELPNIVTPNNDDVNELFIPLFPPRFVESVKFSVYNRWGGKVFESSNSMDINIHWNPGTLSDGIYYYYAEVTYTNRAKFSDRFQKFKGWVQIAR